jgi:hypothetical protein
MTNLKDAWDWYQATADSLWRIERIARRYWDEPGLRDFLGKDNELRELKAGEVEAEGKQAGGPLDDLAVVVMFSVFEAIVRDYLREKLEPEALAIKEPILKDAAEEAIRGVREGSFYNRVLDPLKSQKVIDADLITQVNQVRDYRNWVAHGRRGDPTNAVDPKTAYDRLTRFLNLLLPPPVVPSPEGNS